MEQPRISTTAPSDTVADLLATLPPGTDPSSWDSSTIGGNIATDAGTRTPAELDAIAQACRDAGAVDVVVGEDEEESRQLIQARRLAYPAPEAPGPTLVDDIAVPISALATRIVDPNDAASTAAAHRVFEEIAESALQLGGTVTGEHGVGLLKAALLERELDPVASQHHRQLTDLFDPDHILNPGKMLRSPAVQS
ncbi:hypothetical protein GCM10009676_39530 [Prauserella halophila]|uniref:FAD-binding oxidoreductase/transferase type 4 C-terminal domain-containing protein n=1 Tax=Prauserella halophila TaxID=185641 RepID=A0ABP4H446_9PSEU|nr:FAD-linked oxidase C-terminal domain-containing protein [Prauserella halophila]MCP2238218.1 FAD linked oxidases, C-terminal domain [Prauserella halophila]